ncbi:MAG: putative nucleic acid-binding protein contains domain [Chthonomonadales bacterium]|nr:putative nucleic acid-binding protein contains domain [Chthonomonadales bacterium]
MGFCGHALLDRQYSTGDPWHEPALRAVAALSNETYILTTQEVLTEVLSACAGRGEFLRLEAARMVRAILVNGQVTVLPQESQSFLSGLDLYEHRRDKGYSLVDCISMNAMREHGITEILTNDHHFAQEGFIVLIQR